MNSGQYDPLRQGEDGETYSYALTVGWDDTIANYVYTLTAFGSYPNGERRALQHVSGDLNWANRHAKHYGIDVPEVAKDGK